METRLFDTPVTVFTFDGRRLENFNRGERVKNIQRFGAQVIFEPVSTHRIARTFAMDWIEFERKTTAMRQANA